LSRALGLWVLLFGLWLILSGHYSNLFLAFGIGSCSLATYVAVRMGTLDDESAPFRMVIGAVGYLPWLTWQIFRSNVAVAKIVLDPALPIDPAMVHFKGSQKSDLGRFIYANSITLTPGTITTGIVGRDFEVHALACDAADGRVESDMNQRVTRLEGLS